jgi:hypothetical protein
MKNNLALPLMVAAAMVASRASAQTATVQTPVASASASAVVAAAPNNLSYGVSQVAKLQQAGLSKDVIVNYVRSGNFTFHLRADDIIYLHQLGVPQEAISAMMEKDSNAAAVAQSTPVSQEAPMAQTAPQPTVTQATPEQTAPPVVEQPPVVYSAPSTVYVDPYPYAYYPRYYYGPPVSLSFGFGWGHGWGGGWHGGGGWHHR